MTGDAGGGAPGGAPPVPAAVTPVAPGESIADAQIEPAPGLTEDEVQQLRAERAPTTTPYDPSREREKVRTRLSYAILASTGATGITIVVGTLAGADVDTVLNGVFTPLIGLSGAVMGFYFGGRDTNSR
ncbi:MAG: hypothetical protein MSC31_05235 [Solirubrobacteraceae bacterium MAG38_C4-C5]|nr:hypothetical protein [Candidatus Siliceabacter maunaloa]